MSIENEILLKFKEEQVDSFFDEIVNEFYTILEKELSIFSFYEKLDIIESLSKVLNFCHGDSPYYGDALKEYNHLLIRNYGKRFSDFDNSNLFRYFTIIIFFEKLGFEEGELYNSRQLYVNEFSPLLEKIDELFDLDDFRYKIEDAFSKYIKKLYMSDDNEIATKHAESINSIKANYKNHALETSENDYAEFDKDEAESKFESNSSNVFGFEELFLIDESFKENFSAYQKIEEELIKKDYLVDKDGSLYWNKQKKPYTKVEDLVIIILLLNNYGYFFKRNFIDNKKILKYRKAFEKRFNIDISKQFQPKFRNKLLKNIDSYKSLYQFITYPD